MNVDTIVIETKIVLLVPTMCVLFVHALTAKMFQSRLQGMNTDNFLPAGSSTRGVIKEEDIYECQACNKMLTIEAVLAHEAVCDKIEEYLKSKST